MVEAASERLMDRGLLRRLTASYSVRCVVEVSFFCRLVMGMYDHTLRAWRQVALSVDFSYASSGPWVARLVIYQ